MNVSLKNTTGLKECFQYNFDFYASTYKGEFKNMTLKNGVKEACDWLESQDADSHYILLCNEKGEMSLQSCHADDYNAFMKQTELVLSEVKIVGGWNLQGNLEVFIA